MDIQRRLLKFVIYSNWVLFIVTAGVGLVYAPAEVTKGIICGGLIVILNFHLMYRTLRKSFVPPHVSSLAVVLAKSYVRFVISGIILFFL
ncbi:MAG: ATP synthase subunit I, partial [Deltaproteobacteria bacterium]|nr:ATP synthase subunit I [Deltaproteobacteria bacterium]